MKRTDRQKEVHNNWLRNNRVLHNFRRIRNEYGLENAEKYMESCNRRKEDGMNILSVFKFLFSIKVKTRKEYKPKYLEKLRKAFNAGREGTFTFEEFLDEL